MLNKYFLADRNNKAIDVVDPTNIAASLTQFLNPGFAGFTGDNDTSGPDGVLTANNSTELWVGDSPGKVWVHECAALGQSKNFGHRSEPILVRNPSPAGGQPEPMNSAYDPQNNVIMIAKSRQRADAPFVTFISTTTL